MRPSVGPAVACAIQRICRLLIHGCGTLTLGATLPVHRLDPASPAIDTPTWIIAGRRPFATTF